MTKEKFIIHHYSPENRTKKGTVTVPHPKKDFPIRTVKSIFKQAGLNIH